jgi:HD-GYP domain-containing protein (c-di-GMP phosphodiesterase class II)
MPIPFHAVTALMSALAHRDAATAEHSQRVADICIATAKGLMSVNDCFVLEVAAMLHDIGKLGVPDAILLKPGRSTEEEWKVMRTHDQMGVEIISARSGRRR